MAVHKNGAFGRKFRRAFFQSGLTVGELSKKTGIPTGMIYRYANDGSEPRLTNAVKLARALGTTCEDLMKEE